MSDQWSTALNADDLRKIQMDYENLQRSVNALMIASITVTDENNIAVTEAIRHVRGKGERLAREIVAQRKAEVLQAELQMLCEDYPGVAKMIKETESWKF